MENKNIWVVLRPTASGKTALAIDLAKRLGAAEILSADSRQVYRELNIGVARPEPEELNTITHHFIATISIHEPYSAGRYAREARAFLNQYFENHNHLILCGGTGLYIRALLEGIDRDPVNPVLQEDLNIRLEEGLPALASELRRLSPALAAQTDLQNPQRVIRAMGWSLSGEQSRETEPLPANWKIRKLAPYLSREQLYERINQRGDLMMHKGLWDEAEALFPFRNLQALQTVGYRELFDCMEGKINRQEAIEKIKQHSRNYAKRQLTWFRRDESIHWLKDVRPEAWPGEWNLRP